MGTALPALSKHMPSHSSKSPLIMEWLMTLDFGVISPTHPRDCELLRSQ